jgi:hypothetical protein
MDDFTIVLLWWSGWAVVWLVAILCASRDAERQEAEIRATEEEIRATEEARIQRHVREYLQSTNPASRDGG